MSSTLKRKAIKQIEILYLLKKYRNDYRQYFNKKRGEIKAILHKNGITNIKESAFDNWKIWYGCCYFSGKLVNESNKTVNVFIKVMDTVQRINYENEKKVNSIIDQESPYLSARKPKIWKYIEEKNYLMIVCDFVALTTPPREQSNVFSESVIRAVKEYKRAGILHTDFGKSNIGYAKNQYWFFDYGTSLCSESDQISIRNADEYNHIDKITNQAKQILSDPDFYYDDLIHIGIESKEREEINFLVGKGNIYYAKLGQYLYKYHLEPKMKIVT